MKEIDGKTEDEILKLLKSGNESAFTAVYNHYWDRLYLAAHARLKDASRSEGVVQEVFLQLWRRRSSLQIKDLSAYLSAMTRYAVYKHLASESKIKAREQIWAIDNHSSLDIQSDIENNHLLSIIRDLANELPEKCRLVFICNKFEDQSLKEICSNMEISQKTAEAHLTKALRFIRLKLNNIVSLLVFLLLFL